MYVIYIKIVYQVGINKGSMAKDGYKDAFLPDISRIMSGHYLYHKRLHND
jgi:hypothetical protein